MTALAEPTKLRVDADEASGVRVDALRIEPAGRVSLSFAATAGLWQFAAELDGSGFDWEQLYIDLDLYGNSGQRTGPWDFAVGQGNYPLVPAYRCRLDGEYLGLWFFQRVSLADLRARRFRGRMAFELGRDGEHVLELEPVRTLCLPWLSASLRVDPEECIGPWPSGLAKSAGACPVAAWTDPAFWARQAADLAGPRRDYADSLRAACRWAMARQSDADERRSAELDVPLLIAAARLGWYPEAMDRALSAIDMIVAEPHWGNPDPDAYGHDGDMVAGLRLRVLAQAWHQLGPALGDERRARLSAKLQLQGRRFLRLLLLNRDYWGGSLLQDHGWRSAWLFVDAALHLLDILPDAERWVRIMLPRVVRSIDAQPLDGVPPPSSYHSTFLYLFDMTRALWILRALGGPDLSDHPSLRRIGATIWEGLPRMERLGLSSTRQPHVLLNGGTTLLQWHAARHGDRAAGSVHSLFMRGVPCSDKEASHVHHSRFWAFFMDDPMPLAAPLERDDRPERRLQVWPDSGLALFADDGRQYQLKLRCGPWCGRHSHERAAGPCDRMRMDVGGGGFSLSDARHGELVGTAPSRYSMHTAASSTVLIDDRGQIGDIGYPMSIPDFPDLGESIAAWEWDDAAASGWLELDLATLYPAELGVAFFRRRFDFLADGSLTVMDRLRFDAPRAVSWLFQVPDSPHVSLRGATLWTGGERPVSITPAEPTPPVVASLRRTRQVFSYASERRAYRHVCYALDDKCLDVTGTFRIRLGD